jgi:hypothetical protein
VFLTEKTDSDELDVLFAIHMLTGIQQMPPIKSYFSTNFLLETPVFFLIYISQDRYKLLLLVGVQMPGSRVNIKPVEYSVLKMTKKQ